VIHGTRRGAVTDAEGRYRIDDGICPGGYRVWVWRKGEGAFLLDGAKVNVAGPESTVDLVVP
jgi:hypothetical protein